MGKLQKQLDSHIVAEWRDAYCSYMQLKKELKEIATITPTTARLPHAESEQAKHPTHSGLLRVLSSAGRVDDHSGIFSKRVHRSLSMRNCIQVSVDREGEREDDLKYHTMMLPPISLDSAEVDFFAHLDREVNKVNAFFIQKEEEFVSQAEDLQAQLKAMLEMREALRRARGGGGVGDDHCEVGAGEGQKEARKQGPCLDESFWAVSPGKAGGAGGAVVHPKWGTTGGAPNVKVKERAGGLTYKGNVKDHHVVFMPSGEKGPQGVGASKGRGQVAIVEEGGSGTGHVDDVREKGETPALQMVRVELPAATPVETINRLSKALWGSFGSGLTVGGEGGGAASMKVSARKVQAIERLLDSALREFYRGVSLLQSFSSLNMEAFGKLLKKHDKVSQYKVGSIYLAALEAAHFNSSKKVNALVNGVETWYMQFFANRSRERAMMKLRPGKTRASHTTTFFLGLNVGGIVALLVCFFGLLVVAKGYQHKGGKSYITAVVPVFSVGVLISLHIFMYGINIYCWRAARINYPFIFEFRPGTELRYRQVLLVASALLLFVLGGMVGHLTLHSRWYPKSNNSEYIPLVTILIPFVLLLMPFKFLYYDSRMLFLHTMWHIVLAPLYKVTMPDFFLADQLTSQVPMLRNIHYMFCYYAGSQFLRQDRGVCTTDFTFKWIAVAVGAFPFFFRFLQCCRRRVEEGSREHVWNALKYLSAIVALVLRCQYVYTQWGMWLCIAVSVFATVYGTWWDIVMDWGLLNLDSKNRLLRDNLALSQKWIYFVAILLNMVLRFAWFHALVSWNTVGIPRNMMALTMGSLEIIRRGIWNFFRLENEHLNNVGRFRAVRAMPLPFVYDKHG